MACYIKENKCIFYSDSESEYSSSCKDIILNISKSDSTLSNIT